LYEEESIKIYRIVFLYEEYIFMDNVVELVSFYLKEGITQADFLCVHEKFHNEFISKQKGYISHKLIVKDNTWSELVVWETMEDVQSAFKAIYENAAAAEYMALIDDAGTDDDIPLFNVVKDYDDK
jgi:phenylalanine-4-hydroxylase